jgi:hypothetical protein
MPFTRSSRWAVAVAVTAVLAAVPAAATGSAPPPGPGGTGPSRLAQTHTRAQLSDVALVPGTTQAWAVGYWQQAADDKPLAYRWAGSGWIRTAVPNAGLGAYLQDVVATAKNNAWAVGSYYASTHDHRPYVVHWNGLSWKRVPAPALHGGLRGVSATAGGRPWAVGYAVTDVGGENVDAPLALRWNGTAWKRVATPGLGFALEDVDAVSADNAWAVGENENRTLALHWNGRSWARVATPRTGSPTLEGVTALRTRAWAVGSRASSWYAPSRTLLLSWRAGQGWSRVSVPSPGYAAELNGVAATSATDIWAVGQYQADSGDQRPLVLHWDGATWTAGEPPGPDGHLLLNGVAARSPTRVWTVGYNYFDYNPDFYAYLVRWNGSQWDWWWS